jgi:hypothetical protein
VATASSINQKISKLKWSYFVTLSGKKHEFWKYLAGSYQKKHAGHCKVLPTPK